MTQSETHLIKDTVHFVRFAPGPRPPLITDDRGLRDIQLPIFPPFKASITKDFPFAKGL